MPDRAENNFAIMRCCARVVPMCTVNERLNVNFMAIAQCVTVRRTLTGPARRRRQGPTLCTGSSFEKEKKEKSGRERPKRNNLKQQIFSPVLPSTTAKA
jgi:hypothetical protein